MYKGNDAFSQDNESRETTGDNLLHFQDIPLVNIWPCMPGDPIDHLAHYPSRRFSSTTIVGVDIQRLKTAGTLPNHKIVNI